MKKRIRQFLAWLVAICMTLGALELNMTAVAAESDDDSAYKYTFYDYESGKYTYWEKSPYLINAPWYPGGVFRDYAGLLYLYGDGESDVAAYCADLAQTFTNNWKYKRINLEDASYFDNEHAAKLRAVFSKDTVDEKEYRNYYWHDWSNEELAYAQSKVSGLTRAQALSATQIAIWYCCNGGEMKNTTITKDDVTKVAETFNAMLSLAGGAHVIYKYKGFNGGEIPLETEQDCNDYAKSSSNIYNYALYLLNKPSQVPDKGYILFSDEQFVESSASLVSSSSNSSETVYNVSVQFSLVTNLDQEDSLTLTATLAGKQGTIVDNGNSKYTATFTGLRWVDIDTEAERVITLNVSGQQKAEGVYFYEAKPMEGTTARKASQNMVGPYSGYTTVSATAQVKFNVGTKSVTLVKTDDRGNVVPGAKFSLYAQKGSEPEILVQSGLITDADGKIVVGNLPDDNSYTYIFREDEAPVGYIKQTGDCTVGSNGTATAVNQVDMCDLSLTKTVKGVPTDEHFDFKITLDLSTAKLGSAEKVLQVLGLNSNATEISFTADGPKGCTTGGHSDTVKFVKNTDGKFEATVKLKDGETLKVTGVPADVSYTITELDSGDYVASGTVEHAKLDSSKTVTVTNTRTAGMTSVTVTKAWNDANNQGNTRPDSIQVQLEADGQAYGDSVTLTAADNWTHTWDNLYAYKGTTLIDYTVEEVVPAGYELESTVKTGDAANGYQVVITNKVPTTQAVISGTKELTGDRTENNPEFTFELKDSAGNVVDTQSVTGAGTFTFKTLEYAKAGDYEYTITEVQGNAKGWTYSDKTFNVVVTVTADSAGNLKSDVKTTIGGKDANVVFTNAYTASCSIELEAEKTLTNKALQKEMFSFQLKDSEGNVLQTKTNDANGKVKFAPIEYTSAQVGEHTYTITEVTPSENPKDGITYDTHEETVTVNVVKTSGEKSDTLTATATYSNGNSAKFENSYAAEGEVNLTATKILNGRALTAGQFSFQLKDSKGNVLQTKTNAANGTVAFDTIKYNVKDAGKTFTYTINEVVPESKAAGYSYDEHTVTVTVTVADNGDGTLATSVSYGKAGAAVFTNTYTAKGDATLKAVKTLSGRTLAADQFGFELKDAAGNVLQTKYNDVNGDVIFDAINYGLGDVGKTYIYTISEVDDKAAGYTYDKHDETVTVKVTDNGNGTLDAKVTYDENGAAFANTYFASGKAALSATKTLSGRTLEAGQFSFELKDATGVVLQTKTNVAGGAITFDEITYTQADAGKIFTYTISEVNDKKNGYTYDTDVEEVTVKVTDNGNGTLAATVTYKNGTAEFANSYTASGSAKISATKTLNGRTLKEGQFSFELKDANGTVLQTKTNDITGKVSFDEIGYTLADVGKTYTYTINEVIGDAAGYTYDTDVETVTVTVSDNGDGTLKAEVSYANEAAEFVNSYNASGNVELSATKTLSGRTLEAGQFSFQLKDADGNVLQTKTNAADGTIAFDKIVYTQADVGPHTYTIHEVNDSKPGYSYDGQDETVTVTVTDNGNGTLSVTASYDADGAVFANTYEAEGEAMLKAVKTLSGRTLAEGQFSFQLKDTDGNVLQTKTNAADGTITFDAIEYDEVDAGKTYTYTLNEIVVNAAGYTYDTDVVTVTVKVTDNGDGTLGTSVLYDGQTTATFANTYEAKGSAVLSATKALNGRTLAEGQFSFQLKDKAGTVLQTKTNAADGTISFDAIEYNESDAGKTYTYTINEVVETADGYTYDTHQETVTVTVTDNGNGTLKATATYDQDGAAFVNTYEAEGSAVLEAAKTLNGRTLAAEQFSFQLKDAAGNVLQTKTNTADGSIVFDAIAYDETDAGKTYTYTINEVVEAADGYTYDGHTEKVTVAVTDKGDGTLETSVTYDADRAAFVNTYDAAGSVTLSAVKTLDGRNLQAGQFTFQLKDSAGNVLSTTTNTVDGKVVFGAINYTLADVNQTYTYTINEVIDEAAGYTYDDHTETVYVTVTDNGDGTLKASAVYDTDGAAFANTYKAEGSADLSASKTLNGRTLEEGQFSFQLKDAKENVLQTKTNAADGTIVFDTIAYDESDAGKTFTYTINEVLKDVAGYTYDKHVESVTVTVTDNGDGTLDAAVAYDEDGAAFVNTYEAEGSASLSAAKTLNGRALEAEQFSFELKDADGVVLQTKTNDADGAIAFDTIAYDETDAGKTFTYTISEVLIDTDGYTYDNHVETVTVTVTDNGDGTLEATVAYDEDGAAFVNTYEAEGSAVLEAAKTLTGRTLEAEQFSFELKDTTGTVLQTKTNAADGSIVFDAIAYDETDAGKTFTYTISEVAVDAAGYTYDDHVETVTVTVIDNGDGTLEAAVAYDEDGAAFINTYKAEGSAVLSAAKTLTGRTLEDKQFYFRLTDAEGNVLQNKANGADGTIVFDAIAYDETDAGKTFTYTIHEILGVAGGYTYDKHVETVVITVTDNGDGTLETTVAYDGDGAAFINSYQAKGSAALKASKILNGKTLEEGQFSFQLKDADGTVLQTRTNGADGSIVFDTIEYDEADAGKTFVYTVNEIITEQDGYTYDEHIEAITVTVTDKGNGELDVAVAYDEDGAVFVNTFTDDSDDDDSDDDGSDDDDSDDDGSNDDGSDDDSDDNNSGDQVTIDDSGVPQGGLFILDDEPIPLAKAPKTGDTFSLWWSIAALAVSGTLLGGLERTKRRSKEK